MSKKQSSLDYTNAITSSYDINTGIYIKNTSGSEPQSLNNKYFLSITNTGQMQYITPNYTGFVSGILKFRAIITSI